MYVAANISNPFVAPLLIFSEIQAGAWLRRGDFHDISIAALRNTNAWVFGADLLIGSIAIGAVIGLAIVAGTFAAVARAPRLPPHLDAAFTAAADRYFEHSITGWEFARGKLRRDPVYRAVLEGRLPGGATLVDIGCGQGLVLATLIEARRLTSQGDWPRGVSEPPAFRRLVGIETRGRVAQLARQALEADADIVQAYAPEGLPDTITSALLLDVLHLMNEHDQKQLLAAVMSRLEADGVVLVREADAGASWGFRAVRLGNWIKNVAVGNWQQTFHFRSAGEWQQLFTAQGWSVEQQPMGEGTPFANVLFRLTRLNEFSDSHHEVS
jgi:SAM-dependent methyltransferase